MKRLRRKPRAGEIGHILVVEDDAVLALGLEEALLDAGATGVDICATTDKALAALKANKPSAIVLDVHLADRADGWAIAELLREIGPKPPRIVFSTGAPDEIPEEIAKLGPVLEKPYDPAKLIEAIGTQDGEGLLARLKRTLP